MLLPVVDFSTCLTLLDKLVDSEIGHTIASEHSVFNTVEASVSGHPREADKVSATRAGYLWECEIQSVSLLANWVLLRQLSV